MEAIREIYTVEQGEIRVRLPRQFWGQQVEIIVLPASKQIPAFSPKKSLRLKALDCYHTTTLDIVDALLWAYHIVEHHEVLTFDEKLRKHIQRTAETSVDDRQD